MPQHTIELIQYTPIIHFQGDEPKATLRATEVKPKLDRFLRTFAFQNDAGINKAWHRKSDTGHIAFDYKLRICAPGAPCEGLEDNSLRIAGQRNQFIGCLFQLGDTIRASMATGNVTLSFVSRHDELLEIIKPWLPSFFAVTNFGRRQNKGFGSFMPQKMTADDVLKAYRKVKDTQVNTNYSLHPFPAGVYSLNVKNATYVQAVNSIKDVYAKMVTGGAGWNGYLTKEEEGYPEAKGRYSLKAMNAPTGQKLFYRAMLGLPYRYMNDRVGTDGSVRRFMSPVTFKPMHLGEQWHIYILGNPIPKEMFNHGFTVAHKHVRTPTSDVFDLADFLNHCCDQGYFQQIPLDAEGDDAL